MVASPAFATIPLAIFLFTLFVMFFALSFMPHPESKAGGAGLAERIALMQALAGEERQQVLREYAQLLLDQGQLKLGWARAHPIIDLYLARDLDR